MARIYYRIQPAGLDVSDHASESSDGVIAGVDVFTQAQNVLNPDAPVRFYGDEVLILRADEHWSNGDVEGVRIDGRAATVIQRLPWSAFAELCESTGLQSDELDDAVDLHFEAIWQGML